MSARERACKREAAQARDSMQDKLDAIVTGSHYVYVDHEDGCRERRHVDVANAAIVVGNKLHLDGSREPRKAGSSSSRAKHVEPASRSAE